MKKKIAYIFATLLCVLVAAGFAFGMSNRNKPVEPADEGVKVEKELSGEEAMKKAVKYLRTIYKDVEKETPRDFERIGVVPVGDLEFKVTWSVDVDEEFVKIVINENGMVTIDVNEECGKEVPYVLTATITGPDGKTETLKWEHVIPAKLVGTYQEIVDMAYALKPGQSLPLEATLKGVIAKINTPWSDTYQNITVTILVEGRETKPIQCYRLKGEGAKDLALGDTIEVSGILKNYKGTIEFDAGCILESVVKGDGTAPAMPTIKGTMQEIVDKAYALPENGVLEGGDAILTGSVTKINTAYSSQYKNVTVTIVVDGREDKPVQCYRMKGTNAEKVAVGDLITVRGTLKKFYNTVEFDAGCELTKWVKGGGTYKPEEVKPIEPTAPVGELKTGDKVVIYAPAYGRALSTTKTGFYNVGVAVTMKDGVMSGYTASEIFTVTKNSDGTYSFANGGKNLGMAASYSSMDLGAVNDKWEVIDLGNGLYNVKNVGRGNYIEWYDSYSNWSTYGTDSAATDDQFQLSFYIAEAATVEPEDPTVEMTPVEIVDAAYALEKGASMEEPATLTGTITEVVTVYSTQYKNITVNMVVEGREDKPIQCFRMKGDGADLIDVGDIITVTGTLKNYNGTIEFDSGCSLDSYKLVLSPVEIVDAAYALEENASMAEPATLTGTIVSVDDPYSTKYKNITVTMVVDGREDKPIQCYRLKGDGADVIAVGDIITVTGTIKNYYGTIEFVQPTLDSYVRVLTSQEVVDAGYALAENATLENPNPATMVGTITKVNYAYSTSYKNITVTIVAEGREDKPIECFRMTGDGADKIGVGDIIQVTGTVKNYNGKVEFDKPTLDKYTSAADLKLVDDAYAMEAGTTATEESTLTGTIISIDTPYSEQYSNITVTMEVFGREDKPLQCYRLKGKGAADLAVGDEITVKGKLSNYKGKGQFASGCTLVVEEVFVMPETAKEIVDLAFTLEKGESFPENATLVGVISSIDTAYSTQYKNVTVTMTVQGTDGDKSIQCYRLKGTGADVIAVGDVIQVTGILTNYGGKIQFGTGSILNQYTPAAELKIIDDAYNLASGAVLEDPNPATLTGTITNIDTAYSEQYKNITVTIQVFGREEKAMMCYRMKGDGAADLAVGDKITVTGKIKNYYGTIEFDSGCTFVKAE